MKNERQKKIIALLQEKGFVSTHKLSKTLFASIPTIRRDLILLENEGYLVRSHGGAALPPEHSMVSPVDFRRISHRTEKQLLCNAAQKYLKDYQTIFLDESTTVLPLVKHLLTLKNAVIITNSVDILMELRNSNLEFYCTGGKCILNNNLIGHYAEEFISHFNIDVCVFASSGLSVDGQISDANEYKVGIVKTILKHSRQKIYLCDDSKIGILSKFNAADAYDVDLIITNATPGRLQIPDDKVLYV